MPVHGWEGTNVVSRPRNTDPVVGWVTALKGDAVSCFRVTSHCWSVRRSVCRSVCWSVCRATTGAAVCCGCAPEMSTSNERSLDLSAQSGSHWCTLLAMNWSTEEETAVDRATAAAVEVDRDTVVDVVLSFIDTPAITVEVVVSFFCSSPPPVLSPSISAFLTTFCSVGVQVGAPLTTVLCGVGSLRSNLRCNDGFSSSSSSSLKS